MGYVTSVMEFVNDNSENVKCVIVLSKVYEKIKDKFYGFREVQLGKSLSNRLMRYEVNIRDKVFLNELEKILSDDRIIIKDIDILFDPKYKIDVLRYFCNISRSKKIVVVWNGVIQNDYLQYSEDGYMDYKKYLIRNYDIICIR